MVERIQGHRIDDQRFDMATFLRVRFNSFQSSRHAIAPLTRWSINLMTCVSFILTSLTPALLLLFLSSVPHVPNALLSFRLLPLSLV